jgi:hypothetical protein
MPLDPQHRETLQQVLRTAKQELKRIKTSFMRGSPQLNERRSAGEKLIAAFEAALALQQECDDLRNENGFLRDSLRRADENVAHARAGLEYLVRHIDGYDDMKAFAEDVAAGRRSLIDDDKMDLSSLNKLRSQPLREGAFGEGCKILMKELLKMRRDQSGIYGPPQADIKDEDIDQFYAYLIAQVTKDERLIALCKLAKSDAPTIRHIARAALILPRPSFVKDERVIAGSELRCDGFYVDFQGAERHCTAFEGCTIRGCPARTLEGKDED